MTRGEPHRLHTLGTLQARSYDEATRWGLGWYLRNAQSRSLSHPLPVMRAREIDTWASSYEYTTLIKRHRASERRLPSSSSTAGSGEVGSSSSSSSSGKGG